MPTLTVDTTAQKLPAGGYRNIQNLSGSVTVYIDSSSTVSSTAGAAISPNGVFSWTKDYPPYWVVTAASTADLRIW